MDRSKPFSIVLVNPEIPQNTGNIARLCAATGASLHLAGSIGFSLEERAVRRAGLDYWHMVDVHVCANLSECLEGLGDYKPILFSSKSSRCYLDAPFKQGSTLVFGAESVGLPEETERKYKENLYGIPTVSGTVRSLNLANSVSIALYRALEITGCLDNCRLA